MLSSISSSRDVPPPPDPDSEIDEKNDALHALAAVFPNVRPEVFREMLNTLSKESRAQVVAEHLLRNDATWVKGRWRCPAQETSSKILRKVYELPKGREAFNPRRKSFSRQQGRQDEELVLLEETFRTESYKVATYTALRQEFRSLSRSTMQGVLAEQNFSYTLSRPILVGLAAKTWRASLGNLLTGFRRGAYDKISPEEEHYMLQWTPGSGAERGLKTPRLRHTGDPELDEELRSTLLQPLLDRRAVKDEAISVELAILLNEQEAEESNSMFECQVCYADIAFEQMAMCTSWEQSHVICFGCIQRSMNEALYGQSWDLTIDHQRGQMACVASTDTSCPGCIPRVLAKRAVEAARGGDKVWLQFESRIGEEALRESDTIFVKCPFCSYREVDSLYLPTDIVWSINTRSWTFSLVLLDIALSASFTVGLLILTLMLLEAFLLLQELSGMASDLKPHTVLANYVKAVVRKALATHVRTSHLSRKFYCKAPGCGKQSCFECHREWMDIHKCHDAATVSLRTTVEAARTAALKRTCPQCNIGFIKESGCNKMTCTCGYVMCYVCRKGLGQRKAGRLVVGDADDPDGGYRHFCQHFRPSGGPCTECEQCSLYHLPENEDVAVKKAGERAEREWRERNEGGQDVVLTIDGQSPWAAMLLNDVKNFTLQGIVNWWVASALACRLEGAPER